MSDPYPPYPPAPPPGGFGPALYQAAGYGQPATPARRPGSVDAAFVVMMVRCLLSLVGIVIALADRDEIRRKILDATPTATRGTADTALSVGLVLAVAVLLFYAGLAFAVRRGRNWARIVTWVLAGLAILGSIVEFRQPTVAFARGVDVVQLVLDLVLVVLLAVRPSNEFFAVSRPPRL